VAPLTLCARLMSRRVSRAKYPLRPHTRSGEPLTTLLRSAQSRVSWSLAGRGLQDTPPSFPTRFGTAHRLISAHTTADVEAILAPRVSLDILRALARAALRAADRRGVSHPWRLGTARCARGSMRAEAPALWDTRAVINLCGKVKVSSEGYPQKEPTVWAR